MYKKVKRNFDNIQFGDLRKIVDPQYGDFHDRLSDSYYNNKIFKHPWLKEWGYPQEIDFSILKIFDSEKAKILFKELHNLQDLERQKKFHEENIKQSKINQIPEEKYNFIYDDNKIVIGKNYDKITEKINNLKNKKLNWGEIIGNNMD